MKRFVIYTLIFAILGCAITVLWADIRTRNVNQYYGKCLSAEADGPVYAEAYITSDVDYPGEGDGIVDKAKSRMEALLEGYGIEYEAWARFKEMHLTMTTKARMKRMLGFLAILPAITNHARIGKMKWMTKWSLSVKPICTITPIDGQMQKKRDMEIGMPYRQTLTYPLAPRGQILMVEVQQYPASGSLWRDRQKYRGPKYYIGQNGNLDGRHYLTMLMETLGIFPIPQNTIKNTKMKTKIEFSTQNPDQHQVDIRIGYLPILSNSISTQHLCIAHILGL